MMYNVYYQNQDLDAIISEVEKYDPDILFLMEYSEVIAARIGSAFANYPYQLVQPSRMTMGLALYSRLPLGETTVHRSRETRIPVYDVQLEYDGQLITFVAGHPWPPLPQWAQLNRDQMLDVTAVAGGSSVTFTVSGVPAGAQVGIAVSFVGPGPGYCHPSGLACFAISRPMLVGVGQANAGGVVQVADEVKDLGGGEPPH